MDETWQEKTAKKIAELESLKKLIDEQRTPGGSGIQGGSRFSSVPGMALDLFHPRLPARRKMVKVTLKVRMRACIPLPTTFRTCT